MPTQGTQSRQPHPPQLLQEHETWPPSLAVRAEKPRMGLPHLWCMKSQSVAPGALPLEHLQTWWLPKA